MKQISNSTELQSEQVQSRASFGIEMYPQGSSGSHWPSEVSAANQNQGGKCICSPRISRLARKEAHFTGGSLSFGRAY